MPSPQARTLTARFRTALFAVAAAVGNDVRRAAANPTAGDIDAWWTRQAPKVHSVIETGWEQAARLASTYMTAHAAVEGVAGVEGVLAAANAAQIDTSTRVRGPVAYKQAIVDTGGDALAARRVMLAALEATAQRLVAAGGRETVLATIDAEPRIIGYRRVAAASACAFCAMLASRGAVYFSEAAATTVGAARDRRVRGNRPVGVSYHDHCKCTPEALYSNEPEPPEVLELRRQWDDATAGHSGEAALAAFRAARGH